MTKPNRPKWQVIAKYGDHNIEFYVDTGDEVIAELLRWFGLRFNKEDWPSILKWVEGIK